MAGMPDPSAPAQPKLGSQPYDAFLAAPLAWGAGMLKNTQKVADTAKNMVTGVADNVRTVGDTVTGKMDPMSKEGFGRIQNMALGMAGGGMLTSDAPKGATGMFIGMKSPKWDANRFRGAMELTASGAPHEEILHKTGTSRIPGGHWAQEISDHDAVFNQGGMPKVKGVGDYFLEVQKEHPEAAQLDQWTVAKALASMQKPPKPVKLSDILHHSTLMDAYKGVGDMVVNVDHNPLSKGHYRPPTLLRGAELRINPERYGKLDTTLHELQHHIQQVEGWPKGGDDTMFLREPWKGHMRPGESEFEAYQRLAGEELARATEKRRLLTPEERRQYLPSVHMDNSFSDQIIRR